MKLKKRKYAVGQIIGAGMQLGDMIGQPIRKGAEQFDPQTGEYLDYNKAVRNAAAGSIWAPHKAITASLGDPNASGAEKALSFTSLLGVPGLSKLWANKRYGRLENERKEKLWLNQNPNTIGQSVNPYYMATGGIAGEYAELEDGEPFMTPDGQIQLVNGKTHAQGGEDYILPNGTAILGKNESKVFGEKFKELGAKLKRAQDKHEKILDTKSNPIARRSSLLMLDRIDKEFKDLVNEQEMAKQNSGYHMMPDGSIMSDQDMYAKGGIHIKPENRGKFTAYKKRTGKTTEEALHSKDPHVRKMAQFAKNARKWKHADGYYIPFIQGPSEGWRGPATNEYGIPLKPLSPRGGVFSTLDTTSLGPQAQSMKADASNTSPTLSSGNSFGNTLTSLGELAPIMYNVGQGLFSKPENFDYQQYLNPYIGDIRSTMRNRRFNVDPQLESNRVAQAIYNRNLRGAGASPSQLYAGLQSGVNARQRADAGVYATQQNMNNQYLGQQAEMDFNLGRDIADVKRYGFESNLKSRAAKRNYLSTGLSQLQQYAQIQQLMANQKLNDKEKLALLKDIIPNYFYNRYEGFQYKNSNN